MSWKTVPGMAAMVAVALAGCGGSTAAPRAAPSPAMSSPAQSSGGSQGGTPGGDSPAPGSTSAAATGTARTVTPAAPAGTLGSYRVAVRRESITEPAHAGLGKRVLITELWYPVGHTAPGTRFPLIMFAPGFLECTGAYSPLLRAWASAGYVVAGVNFPRTNCHLGLAAADEADLVHQPFDVSYVLTRLLADPSLLPVPVNPRQVGAAGQSDGGDTVAAMAASTCCTERRLAAVAVLSGAEWPPMPGRYFAAVPAPMLFTQGSADVINPPWLSVQLYRADRGVRYYLDLRGADHLGPYTTTGAAEQVVVRVTTAFFGHYLLGLPGSLTRMTVVGNVPGVATLVSGGVPPP